MNRDYILDSGVRLSHYLSVREDAISKSILNGVDSYLDLHKYGCSAETLVTFVDFLNVMESHVMDEEIRIMIDDLLMCIESANPFMYIDALKDPAEVEDYISEHCY